MKRTFTKRLKTSLRALMLAMLALSLQTVHAQDFVENEDGLVVMEAENYSEHIPVGTSEWVFSEEPVDFSGTGAMMAVTDGPFASAEDALAGSAVLVFSVEIKYPGAHYIWARASRTVDNPGGTDSFHAGVGQAIPESGTFINFEEAFGEEGDGIWKWLRWSNPIGGHAYVDFPSEGVYDFEIYIRENNFRIDKIVLSEVDYQDGVGYGPPPDSIAETRGETGIGLGKQDEAHFSFYPNPVKDLVKVELKDGSRYSNRLVIYDLTGKQMRVVHAGGVHSLDLDLGGLDTGMYYMELQRDGQAVSVHKVLKL